MATPSQLHSYSENFAFQFDAPFPSIVYDSDLSLTGWLVHREGKPIHGLRAVVRRTLRSRTIYTTKISAAPLNFLDLFGFRQFRTVLTRILEGWAYDRAQRAVQLSARANFRVGRKIESFTSSPIKRIDLLATSKSNLFIRE